MNCNGLLLCGHQDFAKDGKDRFGKAFWSYLDPWDSVRLPTASTYWNVSGKCGPHGELFFFLIKKEQVVASKGALPNPSSLRKRSRRAR